MSRLSLAATGWVHQQPKQTGSGWEPDLPIGNRLRWSWPKDAAEGGQRILPARILVERAPIHHDPNLLKQAQMGPAPGPSTFVPQSLWQDHGDVGLAGFVPCELDIAALAGGPVNSVRFVYEALVPGPASLEVFNGDRSIITRSVHDGDFVVLHAVAMDRLTIMSPQCVLRQLSTLDLYGPTSLKFEVIAEIDLAATGTAGLSAVVPRYPASPTLGAGRWSDLRKLWGIAWTEAPGAAGPKGGPNAWQSLQIAAATRWEHAVLCGLGFVDGPNHAKPVIDEWKNLLDGPKSVAYRVRDEEDRLAPSNIFCLPPISAPQLAMLPAPAIEKAGVRLGASGTIRASWDVVWTSPSSEIVGAQIDESITEGGSPRTATYGARGRRATDPPGVGLAHREEEVVSHQVVVTARVRPQDGFDRVGRWGPATTVALPIDHYPQPPLFRSARHDGDAAALTQASPGGWVPDSVVAAAGGDIRICRRVADPARLTAQVVSAVRSGSAFVIELGGPVPDDPGAFLGAQITIGWVKGTITALTWPAATVDVPHGDGPLPAISTGDPAELLQSPTHPSLFFEVHLLPAAGLPDVIAFPDPLPPPVTAEVLEYRAQIVFAGQIAPFGPAVQALRLPATPAVPPPFTVKTLGVDFYQRTVVQLELTSPSSDPLEVWWADDEVSAADFPRRAVPGDAGLRHAEDGSVLFDTLSLPVPNKVDRVVTIGVQAANAGDGRSDFAIVVHTLSK